MKKEKTITISKEKYYSMKRYITDGSIPIEQHIELINEKTNKVLEHTETLKQFKKYMEQGNEKLEKELLDINTKLQRIRSALPQHIDKIGVSINENGNAELTAKFEINEDTEGLAIAEIIEIIDKYKLE